MQGLQKDTVALRTNTIMTGHMGGCISERRNECICRKPGKQPLTSTMGWNVRNTRNTVENVAVGKPTQAGGGPKRL